jgi:peptidoglycan/LPS O-acetylase OafA/YrhL
MHPTSETSAPMSSDRLYGLDVIRVIGILLIILFHYNAWSERIISSSVLLVKNYTFLGAIGVSLFIILSGASLFYSTKTDFDVITFYKKRFFAIFPMFYLVYSSCIILALLFHQYDLTVARNPLSFLLTIVGLDGLFSPVIPNYYLIGEWFLGCIVILYLMFPGIRYIFNINSHLAVIIGIIIFFLLQEFYHYSLPLQTVPLFRMAEFVFGMYYMYYSNQGIRFHSVIIAIILIFTIFLTCFDDVFSGQMQMNIYNLVTFIILFNISKCISGETLKKIISFLSRYSYPAFLVHHIILKQIQSEMSTNDHAA